jgi:hypothetical protein
MPAKKMKDFKKSIITKKVIELKDWDKSPTYASKGSSKIIDTTYSAELYINGKKKKRLYVSSPNKSYALGRFLKESEKDSPSSWLWGSAGKKK